jgi:formylglycine-generating enzyme required for sulfatase activity
MVFIPAGTFTMGSPTYEPDNIFDPDRDANGPQHSVTLTKGFYMGKYQVTQEQYQAVMGSNPSYFTSAVDGESGTPGKLPVEQVSWYDAIVFCNKLSVLEGLRPVYDINGKTDPANWGAIPEYSSKKWNKVVMVSGADGYRLPTEAQWEYACRAGTTTAYNTGAAISDDTGWYEENSGGKTHQTGLKPANTWGLYDMHGNVWEWCWDRFAEYSSEAQIDPTGAVCGNKRVVHGGGWYDYELYLRSDYRYFGDDPSSKSFKVGFRLARP